MESSANGASASTMDPTKDIETSETPVEAAPTDNKVMEDPASKNNQNEGQHDPAQANKVMEEPASKNDSEQNEGQQYPAQPLSKNQQKKLKRRAQFLAERPQRRKEERKKRKAKMEYMKTVKEFDCSYSQSRKRLKHNPKMAESSCKIHVVVDMSFGELMQDKDVAKCCKQVLSCYSINRRLPSPMQFHISGLGLSPKSLKFMSTHDGFRKWDIYYHDESYADVLPKDKIVYLTAESENVLETLEQETYYIIGGLVDHNHEKGLCEKLATEKGLKTARLPIEEFLQMKTRKVLTVNHVFQILAGVSKGESWKEAFLSVLPSRKGATAVDEVKPDIEKEKPVENEEKPNDEKKPSDEEVLTKESSEDL